ncbi:MAG: hypothetical protein C0407_00020 [Desulfobacca sp.]|nr:hypothetical protein [Desulfobacca sp.]
MNRSAKTKDVVGLGSLNVDYIYEAEDISFLKPFCPQGEGSRAWVLTNSEEILEINTLLQKKARLISKTGGGSAANTVFCLAKMGFQSGLVGKIGRDEDGEFLINVIKPIPFQHIGRDQWTGKALIVLDPSRDRIILLVPNANKTLTWTDLDLDFIGSFSFLHMTSLPGEGLRLQGRLAAEIFSKVRISFDPGEVYARRGLQDLSPILSRSEILFITEKELMLLTGLPLQEAVLKVQSLGIKIVAVKRTGAGAAIYRGLEAWDLPAEVVSAKDTTGAGDVFAAGFLAGLLREQSLPDCGRLGLALAHQSMMGIGRDAYPGVEDFEREIHKFK